MRSTRQFVIYSAIGLVNTTIHFAVFTALLRIFHLSVLVSSTIGYAAGMVNSYLMNRAWTFQVRRRVNASEFLRLAAVNLLALALNLLVVYLLTFQFGLVPEISQAFAIVFSLAASFYGNKWWTFREKQH
jgi:putative flippase GtrA